MNTVIDQKLKEIFLDESQHPFLFQVWIDLNVGGLAGPPEWWWNSPPKPLGDALDEAAKARETNWVCIVMPEGITHVQMDDGTTQFRLNCVIFLSLTTQGSSGELYQG